MLYKFIITFYVQGKNKIMVLCPHTCPPLETLKLKRLL